jgi:tetratricopeptide (TPR) repeat protein
MIKGDILNDIGRYEEALAVLEGVTSEASWLTARTWFIKGAALGYLGPERRADAHAAFVQAAVLEPDNIWYSAGVADSLYKLGRTEEALPKFKELLESTSTDPTIDQAAYILAVQGWCHYRLGNLNEAARLFSETQSLDPRLTTAFFNLGLVLLCSGRCSLAEREYEHAVEQLKTRHIWRRKGILEEAQFDLREAQATLTDSAQLTTAEAMLALLDRARDDTSSEVTAQVLA